MRFLEQMLAFFNNQPLRERELERSFELQKMIDNDKYGYLGKRSIDPMPAKSLKRALDRIERDLIKRRRK